MDVDAAIVPVFLLSECRLNTKSLTCNGKTHLTCRKS
ncbi:hypothetical protein APA386B_1P201 (plasmid) [Acetobacter pasteurianus 386B]|nr:hypothetical protein APA386B_1P201 [Acetobacter pasteurianus 386B]